MGKNFGGQLVKVNREAEKGKRCNNVMWSKHGRNVFLHLYKELNIHLFDKLIGTSDT